MTVYEFVTSEKIRAIRRALDFWYKMLRDQMSVIDFLSCCKWYEEKWTS
jgi:hypothetical protein